MEEDIKILEKLIQNITRVNELTLDCEVKLWIKEKQAIENLLTRYKQLEEDNARLELLIQVKEDMIKAKIEELKEIADEDNQEAYIRISALEELLES